MKATGTPEYLEQAENTIESRQNLTRKKKKCCRHFNRNGESDKAENFRCNNFIIYFYTSFILLVFLNTSLKFCFKKIIS